MSLEHRGNSQRVRFSQSSFERGGRGGRYGSTGRGRSKPVKQLHDEVLTGCGYSPEQKGSQMLTARLPQPLMHALASRCDRTGHAMEGVVRVLLSMLCTGRLKVLAPDGSLYSLRGVRPEASSFLGLEFEERQAAYSAGEGVADFAAMMPLIDGLEGEFLACKKTAEKIGSA